MSGHAVEVRPEYVREVTRLKLWYAWRLQKHEGLPFEAAVAKRVGICQLTVFGGNREHGRSGVPRMNIVCAAPPSEICKKKLY